MPQREDVASGVAVVQQTNEHEDWETFSRMRLAAGGALQTYYPLSEEGRREYEAWKKRC